MINLLRLLATASAVFFYAGVALAQNAGTVTNHAFALGKGPGVQGYTSLLCGSAQLAVGQSAADPICQTITGDVTITSGGVTAIGTAKVVTAMMALNAVTNARLAQMANATFKCRNTAGTGDPEDCTAAQVRTLLALVIGTNVQAWDTDLDCLAALASTGIIRRTGAGTCSVGTAVALSEMATQAAFSFVVNNTSGTAAPTAVDIGSFTAKASPATTDLLIVSDQAASGALKRSTIAQVVGALASGVSSIAGNTGAFTLGYGLTNSTNDLRASLTSITASLGADVAMSIATTFYDGPSVAQGTSGTWFASGYVLITHVVGNNNPQFICKLWDGTTTFGSWQTQNRQGVAAISDINVAMSGVISSPIGNIRISCENTTDTSGVIRFNQSGLSKDSSITAIRIAP